MICVAVWELDVVPWEAGPAKQTMARSHTEGPAILQTNAVIHARGAMARGCREWGWIYGSVCSMPLDPELGDAGGLEAALRHPTNQSERNMSSRHRAPAPLVFVFLQPESARWGTSQDTVSAAHLQEATYLLSACPRKNMELKANRQHAS